ncbi:hypothetical protein M011DRAFT_488534 [Sporormia fimetaria CBS 119925]|uniref:DUF4211 domain-containing protein n=1 Tax=Sporormia fimetaria CBS 119925 TaxID=1340428 RepID=A0A6A6V5K1_9PLEO|nr:hypothetical protein M011DRAFT_488534 [Sporormia fimetaria CBS 119925]
MPPRRASKRKLQTKLTFSPVPSHSPAASVLSPSVRDRAAAVSIEPSPSRPRRSKKQQVVAISDDSDAAPEPLPTPRKSFTFDPFGDGDSEVGRGMRLGMPVQTQRNGMFGSSDVGGFGESDSSDSEVEVVEVKKKGKDKKRKRDVSSEDEHVEVKRKGSKKKRKRDVSSSESEQEQGSRRSKRTKRGVKLTRGKVESTPKEIEVESEDEAAPASTRRRLLKNRPKKLDKEEEQSVGKESGGEDSEDELCPPSARRRMLRKRPTSSRKQELEDEKEEDDEDDDAEMDDSKNTTTSRGRSEDSERQELEEELEFLRSSPLREDRRQKRPLSKREKALAALKKSRAAASSPDAPSSSAASRLKRVVIESDSDAGLEIIKEEDESEEHAADSPESGSSDDSDAGGSSDAESHSSTGSRVNAHDIFRSQDDDENFIDDDPDTNIGEPADLHAMPIEFTSLARAKPKELFKYAVEWMVQKKINPGFSSHDEIYQLTFRKLDDEVKGLASSKYQSAAWTPIFTRTLKARPEITISEVLRGMREVLEAHCEACNRKSHPATAEITFTGAPYHRDTLEPLADNSSDSSDSDSDSSSSLSSSGSDPAGEKKQYDDRGELLPPESKIFRVGSTCKANAQMAHTLHHWKYHLNTWVNVYLESMGHCTPEKLVQRDKWSLKKRNKAANKIVDEMERSGEIKRLHRLYREQVDYALEVSNEYRSGWGRRG